MNHGIQDKDEGIKSILATAIQGVDIYIYIYVCVCVCMYIYLFICSFIYLFMYLFVFYLFHFIYSLIYLFMYLFFFWDHHRDDAHEDPTLSHETDCILPSGKATKHIYLWKITIFLMGKVTISMAMFKFANC